MKCLTGKRRGRLDPSLPRLEDKRASATSNGADRTVRQQACIDSRIGPPFGYDAPSGPASWQRAPGTMPANALCNPVLFPPCPWRSHETVDSAIVLVGTMARRSGYSPRCSLPVRTASFMGPSLRHSPNTDYTMRSFCVPPACPLSLPARNQDILADGTTGSSRSNPV